MAGAVSNLIRTVKRLFREFTRQLDDCLFERARRWPDASVRIDGQSDNTCPGTCSPAGSRFGSALDEGPASASPGGPDALVEYDGPPEEILQPNQGENMMVSRRPLLSQRPPCQIHVRDEDASPGHLEDLLGSSPRADGGLRDVAEDLSVLAINAMIEGAKLGNKGSRIEEIGRRMDSLATGIRNIALTLNRIL